jgi:D-alanyl-lipoteichoic acid acyltransferase DltB (MBOAT superfamily)
MLFNSLPFLIFILLFAAGWPLARRHDTSRWAFIIVSSLVFYGWWKWEYVLLLVATALVDFSAGLAIHASRKHARKILIASILLNLGVLGYFKYWFAVVSAIGATGRQLGLPLELHVEQLILPVGISFYTFQSMSYTIDIYRGQLAPTRNVLHFLASISFFPHLVAGPIMRAGKLLPQLLSGKPAGNGAKAEGLRLVVHGYFKKVVIADNLSGLVDSAFASPVGLHSGLEWWVIMAMFSMQIYCDFSGYSDIGRGIARWCGYDFGVNFRHPYAASSIREFWQRWHISLSSWFRDYVYLPLGGSRRSEANTRRNIAVTMLLSAIWHGAGLTFIVWGALHAAYMIAGRVASGAIARLANLVRTPAGLLLVWVQVMLAWVFFRASSTEQAISIIRLMFGVNSLAMELSRTALAFLVLGIVHEVTTCFLDRRKPEQPIRTLEAVSLAMLAVACVFLRGPANAFVYFQF